MKVNKLPVIPESFSQVESLELNSHCKSVQVPVARAINVSISVLLLHVDICKGTLTAGDIKYHTALLQVLLHGKSGNSWTPLLLPVIVSSS